MCVHPAPAGPLSLGQTLEWESFVLLSWQQPGTPRSTYRTCEALMSQLCFLLYFLTTSRVQLQAGTRKGCQYHPLPTVTHLVVSTACLKDKLLPQNTIWKAKLEIIVLKICHPSNQPITWFPRASKKIRLRLAVVMSCGGDLAWPQVKSLYT